MQKTKTAAKPRIAAILFGAALFFLLACLCATGAVLRADAATIVESGTCGDNLTWTLDSDGLLTISGKGAMNSYSMVAYSYTTAPWGGSVERSNRVRSVVINKGVTSIGNVAFYGCTGLTSVTLPDSVTSIGYSAFRDCTRLKSVTIPNSVTSIWASAFYFCTGLKNITIPNSVTSIGSDAFYNCNAIETLTIGKIIEKGSLFFIGIPKTALKTVKIADGVTSIGSSAFEDCTGLTSVTIPNSVTSIGWAAFSGCTGLTNVTIPNSVTDIGNYAFDNTAWYNAKPNGLVYAGKVAYKYKGTMPSNTSISLKAGTKGIANSAFSGCTGLTSVTIPDSVTSIGSNAFRDCTGLTSVTIGNGVTSIGTSAFYDCKKLTRAALPDSVEEIGDYAFSGCVLGNWYFGASLKTIGKNALPHVDGPDCDMYYAGTKAAWEKLPGTAGYEPTFYGCVRDGNVIYNKAKTTAIMPADPLCTSVVLPEGVTSIGDGAFAACRKLKSVTFPSTLKTVGDYAFSECAALAAVKLPDGVDSVGIKAFADTAWYAARKNGVVYAGKNLYAYKGDMPDDTTIEIADGTLSVTGDAFSERSQLIGVTIPNTVKTIGMRAFFGCKGLTELILPSSVKTVEGGAFNGCENLARVRFGAGLTAIGNAAFAYCEKLAVLTVPDRVKTIGWRAFADCPLARVMLGKGLTEIGENAISGYRGTLSLYYGGTSADWKKIKGSDQLPTPLYECVVEKGVVYNKAKTKALMAADQLYTSAALPEGVTSIADAAFYGCSALKTVTLPSTLKSFGETVFVGCTGTTSYQVAKENPTYSSYKGALYNAAQTVLLKYPGAKETLQLADTVQTIDAFAFSDAVMLTDITLPEGIKTIRDRAFCQNRAVKAIRFPSTLKTVGVSAFEDCEALESIELPNSLTTIGDSCFSRCPALKAARIPDSVTVLGESPFYGCSSLESLTVGGGVFTLKPSLLRGCSPQNVTLRSGITKIEENAFYNRSALTTIVIPDTVGFIENNAFYGCGGLTDIYYTGSADSWIGIGVKPGNDALTGARKTFGYIYTPDEVWDLRAVVETEREATLKWTPVSGASEYEIYIRRSGEDTYTKLETVVAPPFRVTDLKPGETVAFSLISVARTASGTKSSDLCDPAYATPPALPPAPGNVKAALNAKNQIEVTWDAVKGADGYRVYEISRMNGAHGVAQPELEDLSVCERLTETSARKYVFDKPEQGRYYHFVVCAMQTVKTTKEIRLMGEPSAHTTAIYRKPIKNAVAALNPETVVYTGAVFTPAYELKTENGETLFEDSQYTVAVPEGRTNAGTYTYVFTGFGVYDGALEKTFTVAPQPLNAESVSLSPASAAYTGEALDAAVTVKNAAGQVLTEGTDYTVTVPEGRTAAGAYTYRVVGMGNYTGTVEKSFTVTAPASVRGDVDLDGQITSADARLALRRAVGLETYAEGSAEFLASDVDGDGVVSAADARLILRKAVGLTDPEFKA